VTAVTELAHTGGQVSDNGFYKQYLGVDAAWPASSGQQQDRPVPPGAQQDAGEERAARPPTAPAAQSGANPQRGPAAQGDRPSGGVPQPMSRPQNGTSDPVTSSPEARPVAPGHEVPHTAPDQTGVAAPGSPRPAGAARQASPSVGPLRASIRAADLVKPYKEVPEIGWRRRLYQITHINLGPSPAEREWNDLRRRISRNLRGTYLVAILQQKGGVAKTTVTIGLGSALARYRDDKIAAVDANAASGNLAKRVDEPTSGTWRGLLGDECLQGYSDFRHYLGKSSSTGLEVLSSDAGDEMLNGPQVAELWRRLQRQYSVALVDCGTQLRDDVMAAVLAAADAVVVVSNTRLDGADGAAETLNWLVDHGYPDLVRSAVIVISDVFKVAQSSSVRKLHEQFEKAVRAVHYVPFDPHLSDATAIDFDRLKPRVRRVFIEAAASLVDGFSAAADKDPGALSVPRQHGEVR
jgi:MinD-like ATPase involved in chromosome partitioning or flagellar assembly